MGVGDNDIEPEEEADIVVDDDYTSVEKINNRLPKGVYYDEGDQQLVVHGELYDVRHLVDEIRSRAKDKGPATYLLTMGGLTLGLYVVGPFTGVAAASAAGIIGALYDRGYIEFRDGRLRLNTEDGGEVIDLEDAKVADPFEVHEDKWYEPDSDKYVITVELPDGDRRYYKTKDGAANRLIEEYGA